MEIESLSRELLPRLRGLSDEANWNQLADDWELMLSFGEGWGVFAADRQTLLASCMCLPYPPDRAWISMVLVTAAARRRGLATQLMQIALARLDELQLTAWLDATDDGRPVYQRLGFVDQWRFSRWARASAKPTAAIGAASGELRPVAPDNLSSLSSLDESAVGLVRPEVLRSLATRAPDLAWHADTDSQQGFVLGRPGRQATQIGPLVASSDALAQSLLTQAMLATRGGAIIDVPDARVELTKQLSRLGFERVRRFTRMARPRSASEPGAANRPTPPSTLYAVAGPELG